VALTSFNGILGFDGLKEEDMVVWDYIAFNQSFNNKARTNVHKEPEFECIANCLLQVTL